MTPQEYMDLALKEAHKAFLEDEVPVGALVVHSQSGKILAKAHNQTERGNFLKHAEILAMQKALKKLQTKRLWDCDLYVTLEPCTMCAAAISFARIKNLFFGASDSKGGAVLSGVKFFNSPCCHHKPNISAGIKAPESTELLQTFFKQKRTEKNNTHC